MHIAIEKLPPYEQIGNPAIREATANLDAAKAAVLSARRTHTQLEQELPQAQEEDAAEDARLRSEGSKLKGRPATTRHEKAIEDAAHEHRVCKRLAQQAHDDLATVLSEHRQAWADEIEQELQAARVEWQADVHELIDSHGRLRAANAAASVGSVIGHSGVAVLRFTQAQIHDLEFAPGQEGVHGVISRDDVLNGLAELGQPEPDGEREPVKHSPPKGLSPNRGQRDVEAEIAEREQQLHQLHTPDRVKARQERAERLRQEFEQALAES
jgi:hypothetical protein